MAEIKVHFSADASALERKFEEIKHHAKEVGEQLGEVGADLGKSLTGVNFEKLLGIGGAVYAATKLGDALIDAAKEGYKAFQEFQNAVLKFKYNAPASAGTMEERGKLGTEMAETAESKMGLFSFKQLSDAGIALEEVADELKLSPEKINELVDTAQALALKTGSAPDTITENFRKLVVSIKEEGSAAVGKFFKSTPGLEQAAGKERTAYAEEYLKGQGVTKETANQDQANEFAKIIAMPIAEFMTKMSQRIGAKETLGKTMEMMEESAPKGIIQEAKDINPMAELNAEIERLKKAFGEDMAPAIREFTKDITGAMPTLKEDFVELSKAMSGLIPIAMGVANGLRQITSWVGERLGIGEAERKAQAAAEEVDKKNSEPTKEHPGGTTVGNYTAGLYFGPQSEAQKPAEAKKETEKNSGAESGGEDLILAAQKKGVTAAQEEAAKLDAKTATEHASVQRQIDFEATQAAFSAQTKAAARGVLASAPTGTGLRDKESAADTEFEAKRINIRAEAAAKERAANEEAENKIAKIKSEIDAREVVRKKEGTESGHSEAEIAARDLVRQAQDTASQSAMDDLHAEAAAKIRDADQSATEKLIDEQEASAKRRADIEYNAAIKAIDARKAPAHEGGPAGVDTFSKFGKHGEVIEGSAERTAREGRNQQTDEQFRARQESDKAAALAKKTLADHEAATTAAQQEKAAADKLAAIPSIKPFADVNAALNYKGAAPPPALPGAAPSPVTQQINAMAGVIQALGVTNSFLQQILGVDNSLLKVFAT